MRRCDAKVEIGRRQFLRGGAITAAGAAVTTVMRGEAAAQKVPAASAQTFQARVQYPANRIANVAQLKVNAPLDIAYPDKDSPGVVLKLGTRVTGGAGPDGDIVAFSTLCPHKGFPLNYRADDKSLNCPGHYSRFDCENGGQQIHGQATQNLPQLTLRIETNGDIVAEGVDELIYGRLSNVL
jgi:arsenite oxidase small subunit